MISNIGSDDDRNPYHWPLFFTGKSTSTIFSLFERICKHNAFQRKVETYTNSLSFFYLMIITLVSSLQVVHSWEESHLHLVLTHKLCWQQSSSFQLLSTLVFGQVVKALHYPYNQTMRASKKSYWLKRIKMAWVQCFWWYLLNELTLWNVQYEFVADDMLTECCL